MQLHATSDDRVRVKLKGRMTKVRPSAASHLTLMVSADSQGYPDQAPLLYLIDPIKLTAQHVRDLTRLVDDKAKQAVGGGPMIFDVSGSSMTLSPCDVDVADTKLCDFIQGWMDENHVPLPKPGEPEPTLMEEMALREEAQRAVRRRVHVLDPPHRTVH